MEETPEKLDRIQQALEDAVASGLTLADRFKMMVGSVRAHLGGNRFPEVNKPKVEERTISFIRDVTKSNCCATGDVDTYRQ